MKHKIVLTDTPDMYLQVADYLETGWIINPELKYARLDHAVVYHLVKYEEGEEPGEVVDPLIVSIQTVPINEADMLLDQGYVIKDTFAKTVTLVKYKKIEEGAQTE